MVHFPSPSDSPDPDSLWGHAELRDEQDNEATDGFVVSIWRQPRPSGAPDYVCQVRRDKDEPLGLAITQIQPSPAP
jgi:hypothetical protein